MRPHSPASLASIPLACAALWLTAAVADAQQLTPPGLPAPQPPAAVSQVAQTAKPAVSQATNAAPTQAGNSAASQAGNSAASQATKHVAPQSPPPAVPQAASGAAASSAGHTASTATNAVASTAPSRSSGFPPPSAPPVAQQAVALASSAAASPQQAVAEAASAANTDASTAVTSAADALAAISGSTAAAPPGPGPAAESQDDADPPLQLIGETGPAVKQAVDESKAPISATIAQAEHVAKPTLQQVQSAGKSTFEQVETVAAPVGDQAQAAADPIVELVESATAPVVDQVQSLTEPMDGAIAPVLVDVSDVIGVASESPAEPIVTVLSEPGTADRQTQPQMFVAAEREPARSNHWSEHHASPTQGEYDTVAPSAYPVRGATDNSTSHRSTQPQRHERLSSVSVNKPVGQRAQPGKFAIKETEAGIPARVDPQLTNPSEWPRLFAAHLLAFNDRADELSGLRHNSRASLHLITTYPPTAIEAWRTGATRHVPAPYNPAYPGSQLPAGAIPAPATASGSISLSGAGSHGGAPPLLADLALATAWRPLWHQATLRPTGIVLPNLAPPG
jgi:hypothetical protein